MVDQPPTIGSWCNLDDAHDFFRKLIDRDIMYREKIQLHGINIGKTMISNAYHSPFDTNIKRDTVAWDITQDRIILKEFNRRINGEKSKRVKKFSKAWQDSLDRSIQLISNIKEDKIDLMLNGVPGLIGKEEKRTVEEMKILHKLDDPNNPIWTSKRRSLWKQKFIQIKLSNNIKWQEFCVAQEKK